MGAPKIHANVAIDVVTWRRFVAGCVEQGTTVQGELGRMVYTAVRSRAAATTKSSKRRAAKKVELDQALAELDPAAKSASSPTPAPRARARRKPSESAGTRRRQSK